MGWDGHVSGPRLGFACLAAVPLKTYRSKRTRQGYLHRIGEIRGEVAMYELRAEMMVLWQWKEGQKK
jgi:hypothetical protein